MVGRHVDRVAEPEAEQDALLHPRVDAPSGRTGRIRHGRTDGSGAKRALKVEKCFAGRGLVGFVAKCEQRFDRLLQVAHTRDPATTGRPKARMVARILSCEAARGETIGNRYASSHRPIAAIANFTGPGLDSMKFTCMRGMSFSCQRRAAAKSPLSA